MQMHASIIKHQAAASTQRGYGIMEVIGSLAIIAFLGAIALGMIDTGFSDARTKQAMDEVVGLRVSTQKLYINQSSYGTASLNATLIANGAIPGTLKVSGATILNSWGGGVTITGAASSFTIAYASVPKEACISLVTGTTANGWTSVKVGAGTANTPPVLPATAATDCAGAANTITWASKS